MERLQRRREHVVESYAGILPGALDALSGEERRLYGMLRLEVAPTQGTWRLPVLLVLLAHRR